MKKFKLAIKWILEIVKLITPFFNSSKALKNLENILNQLGQIKIDKLNKKLKK